MMNIAKIMHLLLAIGHFWSNWAPWIGNRTIMVKINYCGPWIGNTIFMGQHGAPWVDKIMPSMHSGTYYVFQGRVTLFFADNFSTECRITMEFLHNFF